MKEGFLGDQQATRADNQEIRQKNNNADIERNIAFHKLCEQIRSACAGLEPQHNSETAPHQKAAENGAGDGAKLNIVQEMILERSEDFNEKRGGKQTQHAVIEDVPFFK